MISIRLIFRTLYKILVLFTSITKLEGLTSGATGSGGYCYVMEKNEITFYQLKLSPCYARFFFICQLGKFQVMIFSLVYNYFNRTSYIYFDKRLYYFCGFAASTIKPERKRYIADPIGLWPLSKNAISENNKIFVNTLHSDSNANEYQSNIDNLGFQSLHTPVHLPGSPFFADVQSRAILELSKATVHWSGISILFWIKLEDIISSTKCLIMVYDVHFHLATTTKII